MELLGQELRKIWRPGLVACIAALGVLYYLLFPSFLIGHFNNGATAQADYDLAAGWVARFGPTMEPEERAQLDAQLAAEQEEFGRMAAALPAASRAGLADFAAFEAFREAHYAAASQEATPQQAEAFQAEETLIWEVMDNTNFFVIQQLQSFMDCYDSAAQRLPAQDAEASPYTPAQQARIAELEAGARGYLPWHVRENTAAYGSWLAVWTVLSVVLLLSPTLVRDRLHRVRPLQWASRRGRGAVDVQMAAGMLSALALSGANLAVYGALFASCGPLAFAECPLYSWVWGGYAWFDWTFGQYLAVLAALLVALGLAAGAAALFLSRFSGSYVAMLLKALPLFVALGALFGAWLLDGPFYFKLPYAQAASFVPAGTEFVCAGGLLAACVALVVGACAVQRRRELLA